jgi:hypothetical protein
MLDIDISKWYKHNKIGEMISMKARIRHIRVFLCVLCFCLSFAASLFSASPATDAQDQAQDLTTGLSRCNQNIFEIEKALAISNYAASQVTGDDQEMKKLDLDMLLQRGTLKEEPKCPNGGIYQINDKEDVECSVHRNKESTEEEKSRSCEATRRKIVGALILYNVGEADLYASNNGFLLPESIEKLFSDKYLAAMPQCPCSGTYTFYSIEDGLNVEVKCSEHGTSKSDYVKSAK